MNSISNSVRFKPALAERDKKQTIFNLRNISTNWFKRKIYTVQTYGSQDCGLNIFVALANRP
jgi:hypothetical protein